MITAPELNRAANPRLLRHVRHDRRPIGGNAAFQLARQHALVHFASGAVYSFIPKNACSTMRLSLAIDNGFIAGPDDWVWIHANNGTFSASLRDLACAPYTFTILRCPYARLASAWLDKIVGRMLPWWDLYRQSGDQIDYASLTFRRFVIALRDKTNLNLNIHWRPQTGLLVYENYDDWFALEAFDAVPARLAIRCGLTVVDARNLTRHGTDQLELDESRGFADMPAPNIDAMLRQNKAPSHRSFYDDALASIVRQIYREDIALYVEKTGGAGLMFPEPSADATADLKRKDVG